MKVSFILLSAILMVACNSLKSIKSAFTDASPYEKYVLSLEKAELLKKQMAKDWLLAGEKIFYDSVMVTLPFSESGYFQASNPEARSYRFKVKDGQVITINGAVKTEGNAKVFLDLFGLKNGEWKQIAHGDSTFSLTYEFSRDYECVVRLQPELLVNAYYAVNISVTPVLINPVSGASNKSIGSFYGASRDGGKRSHEGVDIFAKKGTPVVAPTDGYISRVGVNQLGGKVVWMKDAKRGHSYYFAHLDSQLVQPGVRVKQGHVLGLVGNTGNAKKTPPHLHFGIYQHGAKDPLYYIHTIEQAMKSLPIDTGFHQKPFKVKLKKANLMAGPSEKVKIKSELEKNTYLTVIGQSHDWYRIALPDYTEGFILKNQVEPLATGTITRLDTMQVLLSEIRGDAVPVAQLEKDSPIEVLATFRNFNFVQTENGIAGWIYN
jgi:murein DD-endopeptidase MepM/ murein hydrolase activator NlpD